MKGRGEVFQEGAAAGGAGLVDHDVGDHAPVQPDGLHVLAADVQKEGGVWHVLRRRSGVGHRLHHMVFRAEGTLHQKLSIARGTDGKDGKGRSGCIPFLLHFPQSLSCHLQRFSRVGGVEGIQKVFVLVDQHEFGGGAAAVDAEIGAYWPGCRLNVHLFPAGAEALLRQRVTAQKFFLFLRRFKEEGRGSHIFNLDCFMEAVHGFQQAVQVHRSAALGKQAVQGERRSVGHDGFRMLRHQNLLFREVQTLGKHLDQRRIKGHRAALKKHGAADVQSLCQAADGLLRNGMERGERQVFFGNALIQKGLDIRFGIDAAAAGDVIDRFSLSRRPVQLLHGNAQDGGNLVQKGARAAGAASVHPHIRHFKLAAMRILSEKQNLGILAAQFDGGVYVFVQLPDGDGICHHLLHVGQAEPVRKRLCAGAGEGEEEFCPREFFQKLLQTLDHARRLLGAVPAVTGVYNLSVPSVYDDCFGGG